MSARRERTPAGLSNSIAVSSRPQTARLSSARPETASGRFAPSRGYAATDSARSEQGKNWAAGTDTCMNMFCDSPLNSGRPQTSGRLPPSGRSLSSGRPQTSHNVSSARPPFNPDKDARETLRRARLQHEVEAYDEREAAALGAYNSFSVPRPSRVVPLRTVFLDPEINNFPPSRTRTELMKRIRLTGLPHPSFDMDRDGMVSQADYRLAKRFDVDNNGVLDAKERQLGRQVLAEEFFTRHENEANRFGEIFANRTAEENTSILLRMSNFDVNFAKLGQAERTLEFESGKRLQNCLDESRSTINLDRRSTEDRFAYHTDKMDTTAFTSIDRLPTHAWMDSSTKMTDSQSKNSWLGATVGSGGLGSNHYGSRNRLLISRKEELRRSMEEKLRLKQREKPIPGFTNSASLRRINLITSPHYENE